MKTQTKRNMEQVNFFNPLRDGDVVEIQGVDWMVKCGGCGWQLRRVDNNELHPTIKDIFGMIEFLCAINNA